MKAIEMRSMRPPVNRQRVPKRRDVRKNTNPGDQHEILDWEVSKTEKKSSSAMGSCFFRPVWKKIRTKVKHPGMDY